MNKDIGVYTNLSNNIYDRKCLWKRLTLIALSSVFERVTNTPLKEAFYYLWRPYLTNLLFAKKQFPFRKMIDNWNFDNDFLSDLPSVPILSYWQLYPSGQNLLQPHLLKKKRKKTIFNWNSPFQYVWLIKVLLDITLQLFGTITSKEIMFRCLHF